MEEQREPASLKFFPDGSRTGHAVSQRKESSDRIRSNAEVERPQVTVDKTANIINQRIRVEAGGDIPPGARELLLAMYGSE